MPRRRRIRTIPKRPMSLARVFFAGPRRSEGGALFRPAHRPRRGRGLPPLGRDESSIPVPLVTQTVDDTSTGPLLDYAVPVLEEVEPNPEESAAPEDRL